MRHSSQLEVDLSEVGRNYTLIQNLAPKAKILPMVKADAYGHGLLPVASFLSRECGAETLGVATLGEALQIVRSAKDLTSTIMVFSETGIGNSDDDTCYVNYPILPVLHRLNDVEHVLRTATLKHLPLVIKVNTGMNRLGLNPEEWERAAQLIRQSGRPIDHLMSHFAMSFHTLKEGDRTQRQYARFQEAKNIFMQAGVPVHQTSMANSGAIEQQFATEETWVRPGLMLYGPPSVVEDNHQFSWQGKMTSRLVTRVLSCFPVKRGTPVGYGVNVAPEDGFMVVVPLGYGDGIPTWGAGAYWKVDGMTAKLFGRVNMDMCFFFFGPSAAKMFKTDQLIELWGKEPTHMLELCSQMKTIPYQLLCGLSSRVPRVYRLK